MFKLPLLMLYGVLGWRRAERDGRRSGTRAFGIGKC